MLYSTTKVKHPTSAACFRQLCQLTGLQTSLAVYFLNFEPSTAHFMQWLTANCNYLAVIFTVVWSTVLLRTIHLLAEAFSVAGIGFIQTNTARDQIRTAAVRTYNQVKRRLRRLV